MMLLTQIRDSGFMGYLIIAVGIVCAAIIIERFRALYFTYSMKSGPFMEKIRSLVLEDKIEDAITTCSQYEHKPLGRTVKLILERSDRDEDSLFQGQDIALTENVPKFSKRLTFLMMLSNVSTLLGLLGTIQGLIVAFAAVGQADPSVKQTMLAEGISVSMYTTAIGLVVAIPTMILYSFLNSRATHMSEEIIEHSTKVVELLTSRQFKTLDKSVVFPTNIIQGNFGNAAPPPTNIRAA